MLKFYGKDGFCQAPDIWQCLEYEPGKGNNTAICKFIGLGCQCNYEEKEEKKDLEGTCDG